MTTRGRPKTEDPKKIRSVRFTDAEWNRVQSAAKAGGLTASEFVRRAALERVRDR